MIVAGLRAGWGRLATHFFHFLGSPHENNIFATKIPILAFCDRTASFFEFIVMHINILWWTTAIYSSLVHSGSFLLSLALSGAQSRTILLTLTLSLWLSQGLIGSQGPCSIHHVVAALKQFIPPWAGVRKSQKTEIILSWKAVNVWNYSPILLIASSEE